MLAVALRCLLLGELLLYAGLARRFFEAPPLLAGLAALGGLLGARLGFTVATWCFAWVFRSPSPRLPPWRVATMWCAEYAACVALFVLILPFARQWLGADRQHPAGGRPPLLLIHGYGCSRGVWWWLRRRLESAGWQVATLDLEPPLAGIDSYAEPIARRVDALLAETGAPRVVLVGHSMGGLAARAYLRRFGGARVERLVTLGTPHAGSVLARLGPGRNARQMEPGSAWLQALALSAPPVETVSIYSRHDNYVMPQDSMVLPGAACRPVDGVGHLAMLFSPRVASELLAALEKHGNPA